MLLFVGRSSKVGVVFLKELHMHNACWRSMYKAVLHSSLSRPRGFNFYVIFSCCSSRYIERNHTCCCPQHTRLMSGVLALSSKLMSSQTGSSLWSSLVSVGNCSPTFSWIREPSQHRPSSPLPWFVPRLQRFYLTRFCTIDANVNPVKKASSVLVLS